MSHRTLIAAAIATAILTPAAGGLAYMHFGWVAGVAATLVTAGVSLAAAASVLRDFADALQGVLYGADERSDEELNR